MSTELKEFCKNKLRIPEKDIEVVIHGITPSDYFFDKQYVDEFKAKNQIQNEKIIGLFARMAPMKNHACLIEALAKMPQNLVCQTKTVLFGGTEGEYVNTLKQKIRAHGLEQHVLFEGFVSASQALSLSDITVLPSDKEGFGIVSIESFLMKKPHIRTKTAGYKDICNGCIGIEVGDSDALCSELTEFIQGKDYSSLIETAYRIFEEKCSTQRMAERILKIYEETCTK